MRTLSSAFAARLAADATTLAHVWVVTRRDGQAFAFTDHDRDLAFAGLVARAGSGLAPNAIDKAATLAPDTAGADGALSGEAITAEDLAAGLWDGAMVALHRVDWRDPTHAAHLFAGRLGEISTRADGAFTAELRGLKAQLDATIGRVIARDCDAELGDGRCGVDLEDPRWRASGVVATAVSDRAFRAGALAGFPAGLFTGGRLAWAAGGAADVTAHAGDLLELADPAPSRIAPGAGFTVVAGCDKRLATCRDRYQNTARFRGFPHVPGPDALLAVAREGQANDGGSRW